MTDFVKIANVSDVPEGRMKAFNINGEEICVFNVGGKMHAVEEICPHQGGPMSEGTIEDGSIVCPWHSGKFDIETGKVSEESDFVKQDLKIYEVKTEGDDILVKI